MVKNGISKVWKKKGSGEKLILDKNKIRLLEENDHGYVHPSGSLAKRAK